MFSLLIEKIAEVTSIEFSLKYFTLSLAASASKTPTSRNLGEVIESFSPLSLEGAW